MIPGIFVAGTGTDVGKTMVVAGIMRHLLQRGVNAMAMKPVQTGVVRNDAGRAVAPDIHFVLRAADACVEAETMSHLAPCLYEPACSPHLAARLAGQPVRIESIMKSARWLADRYQFLVAEGAGGLMVPLGETGMMIDLVATLEMPVVLVGHSGLGTINHVLLSIEALRRRQLRVLGVILNDTHPIAEADRFIHDDNVRAIESFGAVRVLARIPWLGAPLDLARLDQALTDCDFLQEL